MQIDVHRNDLPESLSFGPILAIDSETMGLNPRRDRLCLVQLYDGGDTIHLMRVDPGVRAAPVLQRLVEDQTRLKLMHFARFDAAALRHHLGIDCRPVYCTKIASKLARTYSDRHGLKELCRELLGVEVNKNEQSSYWGAETLSDSQLRYAAGDVQHLHALKDKLDGMLVREGRAELARACFEFLPHRVELDLRGWDGEDVFAH